MRIAPSLLVLFGLVAPTPAHALRFRLKEVNGRQQLLVYDCKKTDPLDNSPCEWYEGGFQTPDKGYLGDAAVFHAILQRGHISEVVVFSGGGLVAAAVPMARDLRAHGLGIRVPHGLSCVSSCTIFFMGGVIRTVEDGADYKVHSASTWADCVDAKSHEIDPRVREIADHPDVKLTEFARLDQANARMSALRLLRLFQNTLILPTGRPAVSENDDEITAEAEAGHPPLAYLQDGELERDVHRIRAEGRAAVQDVMMRLEREQMASAIQWLAGRTDLGYRSAPALEMVRMMYMEAILETSTLSRSELERRGYVTPQI